MCQPDFISYNVQNIPNKYVARKKVPVITWTVNSKDLENKIKKFVDSVVFEGYVPDKPLNY